MTRGWKALTVVNSLLIAVLLFLSVLFGAAQLDSRRERSRSAAVTDRRICERQNSANDILADLLRDAPAGGNKNFKRAKRNALKRLEPVPCRRLPSQRPFKPV